MPRAERKRKTASKSLAQAANRACQSKLTSMFITTNSTSPANADVSSESTEDNTTAVHM